MQKDNNILFYSNLYFNLTKIAQDAKIDSKILFKLNSCLSYIGIKSTPIDINKWINLNSDIFNDYALDKASFLKMKQGNGYFVCMFLENKSDSSSKLFITQDINSIKNEVMFKNTFLIKGFNNIKNLVGFTLNNEDKSYYTNDLDYLRSALQFQRLSYVPSKYSSHNIVLFNALNELVNNEEVTDLAMQANKETIDSILTLGGSEKNILGKGVDGVAVDIGNGKVLKFFTDKFAYNKACEAMNRIHKNPELADTEAMIYDAGTINLKNNRVIYYYVIEKMTPMGSSSDLVASSYRFIINSIKRFLRYQYPIKNNKKFLELRKLLEKPKAFKYLRKKVNEIAKDYVLNDTQLLEKSYDIYDAYKDTINKNWLLKFVEECLMKHLTGRGDLHLNNVGINSQGYLRFFDPSHSIWSNYINTGYGVDFDESV